MKNSTSSQAVCCERSILTRLTTTLQISLLFVLLCWSAFMSAQGSVVPVNDDCDGAIAIACGETFQGTTADASADDIDFCGQLPFGQVWGEPGVWFTHVGHNDNISLNLSEIGNAGFDTFVGVYTGECDDLVCVTGDDDSGPGFNSAITFFGEEGVLYYIYVTGWQPSGPGTSNGDSGPFTFNLECTPVCEPALEIACASDVTIECGQDINDLELTGAPSYINLVLCDGSVELDYSDVLVSSNDCVTIWARTWTAVLGDLTSTCTQLITVQDTQGPVFPELMDVNVQCLEEVPGPIAVTAVDVCSGETSTSSFTSQTGELISSCDLSSAYGPGADWSVWLPTLAANGDVTNANFHFDANGGTFDQFMDGTAHLYGTVENSSNPSEKFIVDLWLNNKADWATWSSMGRNYKNDLNLACATADHINWSYYELIGGFSTLTGADALAGDVLYIYHQPASYYFGFQVGIGANNKNCNNGLSGWFTYEGFVGGESVEGHGDVNVDGECTPNQDSDCIHNTSFTHFYRAVDACGNATIASYDVIVEDTTAPEFSNCPESIMINCEDVVPAVAENVMASDNCAGDVTVAYLGETAEGNACYNVLTRTWSAIDVCGNRSFCTQTITIVDVTAPVLAGTPEAEITVECDMIPAAADVTATDNCLDVVVVDYNESTIDGNCPGYYTIIRTWTAEDNCDNSASFTQTIHVEDTTAPVFDEYDFYAHIECDEIPAVITATDNCGDATVEVTYEILNSGGCLGVYHRIYTATDACGNTATAEQYIAIQDLTAPVIVGVPAEDTVECSEVALMDNGNYFTSGDVYGTDNCEMEVTISYNEEVVATDDNCPQSYDIIRRWIATDYCENMDTAFQTVHVVDTTAPWFNYVPEGAYYSCEDEVEYSDASAEDNCGAVTIEVSVDTVYQGCPQSYDIVRTFIATDECGNVSEPATQTIEVRDTTAPYFNDYQSSYTFECGDEIVLVDPIAGDICGAVTQYSYNTEIQGTSCAYSYTHITVATDECGNENTAYQSVYVQDTTAPVVTAEPEIEMPCEEFSMESGIFASATDICNSFEIYIASTTLYSGECAGVYYREYYAVDACGNSSEIVGQIIRLTDLTAPVGTEPSDIIVECGDEVPGFNPNFTDNCGGDVVVSYEGYDVEGTCNVSYTESWTGTDNCGNYTVIDRIVTFIDTQDPWFVEETLPASTTIECTEELPAVQYPSAYDVCDMDVEVEMSTELEQGSCPSNYTVYRMFRAFDECGNEAFYTQTITVQDTQAPYFEEQESTFVYECNTVIPVITPSAGDFCSTFELSNTDGPEMAFEVGNETIIAAGSSWEYQFETFTTGWATGAGSWSSSNAPFGNLASTDAASIATYGSDFAYNTFWPAGGSDGYDLYVRKAVDLTGFDLSSINWGLGSDNGFALYVNGNLVGSGNAEGFTFRWEYGGTIPASFLNNGINYIAVALEDHGGLTAFDMQLTGEHNFDSDCITYFERTWTATDACGNSNEFVQTIFIQDTTAPTLSGEPEVEVPCEEFDMNEGIFVSADDNCQEPSIEIVSTELFSGECAGVYYREYQAYDGCGNYSEIFGQIIRLIDVTAPVGTEPMDIEISCDEVVPAFDPNFTDNCGGEVIVTHTAPIISGYCNATYTETWTAVDNCGNTSSVDRIVTVVDNVNPWFTYVPASMEVECNELYMLENATAADNCDDNVAVTVDAVTTDGDCPAERVITRTFTATDNCGNTWTAEQTISIVDTTAPYFEEQASEFNYECLSEVEVIEPMAGDDCSTVSLDYSDSVISEDDCVLSFVRNWVAIDACGNMSEFNQYITIYDETAPVIATELSNVTVECASEIPAAVEVFATDNCDQDVQVIPGVEVLTSDDCGNQTLLVYYYAYDECGNFDYAEYTITVNDVTAPELSGCPADLVLACDAEIPAPATVTAMDNCQGELTPLYEQFYMGEMPAEGSIADCDLLTPDNSNALCAAAAQGQDWAMVLFSMAPQHRYYHVTEGNLVQYPDGSIHVEATLVSNSNPSNGFYVNVHFNGGLTWSEFTSQGFPTNFKADCDGIDANHEEWLYYYMTASEGAELTGFGGYAGSSLNLVHAPANNYFGFQLGAGANNLSASENGFGGWFSYSGTFIVNGSATGTSQGSVTGSGDFAFDLDCCPDYYIVRQWTVADCSGNESTCTQYITFEGTDIQDNINTQPSTPEVAAPTAVVSVYPNPATDNATFTFKSIATAKSKLEIFDLAGAKVAEVFNGKVDAGMEYKVDVDVNTFATGVYMFRLTTGDQVEMGRLVINK